MYASGAPAKDPDILLFHLCRSLNCLPSELEDEDPLLMEKFLLIDTVITAKAKRDMEKANG